MEVWELESYRAKSWFMGRVRVEFDQLMLNSFTYLDPRLVLKKNRVDWEWIINKNSNSGNT